MDAIRLLMTGSVVALSLVACKKQVQTQATLVSADEVDTSAESAGRTPLPLPTDPPDMPYYDRMETQPDFDAVHGEMAISFSDDAALGSEDQMALTAGLCACKGEAKVYCTGSEVKGAVASADYKGCYISMSEDMCSEIGRKNGGKVDLASSIDALTLVEKRLSATSSAKSVFSLCIFAHEARHICDGPKKKGCESEQNGYAVGSKCFRAYNSEHCRYIGDSNRQKCYDVGGEWDYSRVGEYINESICEGVRVQDAVDTCSSKWNRYWCERLAKLYYDDYHRYQRPTPGGAGIILTAGQYKSEEPGIGNWTVEPSVMTDRMRTVVITTPKNEKYTFECWDEKRCKHDAEYWIDIASTTSFEIWSKGQRTNRRELTGTM